MAGHQKQVRGKVVLPIKGAETRHPKHFGGPGIEKWRVSDRRHRGLSTMIERGLLWMSRNPVEASVVLAWMMALALMR